MPPIRPTRLLKLSYLRPLTPGNSFSKSAFGIGIVQGSSMVEPLKSLKYRISDCAVMLLVRLKNVSGMVPADPAMVPSGQHG